MEKKEIKAGESSTLEFKETLPTEDKKYLKTVVAFANSKGGRIVFGIKDDTLEIVGVDKDKIFTYMDSIANAIAENCAPTIIPDIIFQTIEGKTIIIAEVYPGQNKPYYLKNEGITDGTYIRLGATTRRATYEKVQEFILYGKHQSYDELPCTENELKEEKIKQLCNVISSYSKKEVTKENLISWKLLVKQNNKLFATNAFELLTENSFTFAKTQCARFKGTDKNIFIDKKELEGPLYEQIESAYNFVLSHINLSAHIEGLLRIEDYEIPAEAIREIIINAIVHRNYLTPSYIQVAIFDDRVEVSSPGGLFGGITVEKIKNGSSSIRNKVLADIFSKMELVEHWGIGIKKVFALCKEKSLKDPVIEEKNESIIVTLWRTTTQKTTQKTTETEEKILAYLYENKTATRNEIASALGTITADGVKYNLAQLQTKGLLKRVGGRKNGYWEIQSDIKE